MTKGLSGYNQAHFEQSADAMLIIDGHEFVEFNPATVRMLRYGSREELMAAHPSVLSPPQQPDGKSSFEKAEEMMAIAHEQGTHRFEWMHRRADGDDFSVEVTLTSISRDEAGPMLHVVWRDITETKRAEQGLRLAQAVLESTSEGVLITDLTPRIIEVNPAYCDILGYSREEVIGQNPNFTRSQRHSPEFYSEMWAELAEKGQWTGEIWDRRKNGEVFPKHLRINTIFDEQGSPVCYAGVFSDITERKEMEKQLHTLAYKDALTMLPNRVMFHDRLQHAIYQAERDDASVALLFIDLNEFKQINDTMGHTKGDELLVAVAENLSKSVRASDTVARLSGDEFTVIIENVSDDRAIGRVVESVMAAIGKPVDLGGRRIYPAASIGISVYPRDGKTTDDLVRNADIAMYAAKAQPGCWYQFFDGVMNDRLAERVALEQDIRDGLMNREFFPHYQPIVNLDSGEVVGAEALARWQHSDRGTVYPDGFIDVAEETDLIRQIGRQILTRACCDASDWPLTEAGEIGVSVNVSARQFRDDAIVDDVFDALATSNLCPDRLTLEITESLLLKDLQGAVNALTILRSAGIKVAIDDFGTGYSSLSQLQRLPVTSFKMDRSFIVNMDGKGPGSEITRAIVAMSNCLRIPVVAEGVETDQQVDTLRLMGCPLAQGYHYAKPMANDQFVDLIACDEAEAVG